MADMVDGFQKIKTISQSLDQELDSLRLQIDERQKQYHTRISEISKITQITQGLNEEAFRNFVKEPYVILPSGRKEEWYVAVPKFIRMNLGWLDHATETYNVFRINKFMKWLGDIPPEIEKKFKFDEQLPFTMFDGMLLTGKSHQEQAWNKYHQFLNRREGKDKIKIKRGYEFKLLAQLIDDGILPFLPQPVEKDDQREFKLAFEMRDYQKDAWNRFQETGAVGVFWAYSAGKTFFGIYAGAHLKGNKLVVVPTKTLQEQWNERIRKYVGSYWTEWEVVTYHAFERLRNKEFVLVIYDEVQHLPANTFSRFATLKTKYRIGLSATPYREDQRENYMFALTGFPIGLSWDNLIRIGVLEIPDIRLYIVEDWRTKMKKLNEILQTEKKTIIFCDSIDKGTNLSKTLEVPFVHGGTSKRLDIIRASETCIVSRVGDEGLSIPDIQRVIEIDFQFGSRRQEGQRIGRLFHGEEKGEHIVLMTETEFENYQKRFYAIYEKGLKMEIIR